MAARRPCRFGSGLASPWFSLRDAFVLCCRVIVIGSAVSEWGQIDLLYLFEDFVLDADTAGVAP